MNVITAHAGPSQRRRTLAAALAAALVLPLATAGSASADDNANGDDDAVALPDVVTQTVDSPAAADEVEVVVVHGIPDVEVDVLVDGDALLSDVSYTDAAVATFSIDTATPTTPTTPTTTTIDVEIVEPGTTDVIAGLSLQDLEVAEGTSYTVAAFLDADGDPTIDAFVNETDETGIQAFHLAEFADVAIVSDGTILADDLANGETVKLDVPGGTTVDDVGIALAGETDAAIGLGDVTVPEDSVVLVYAVGPEPVEEAPEPPTEPEDPELPPLPEILVEAVDVPTSTDGAEIVLVHGVPDLDVDVLVDGDAAIEGFAYGETVVATFTADTYDLGIAAAGSTTPILQLDDVELNDGDSFTVAAYLEADGTPTLAAFVNETDSTGIQAFHLAEFPEVALLSGDTTLADPLANNETVKLDVAGGETVVDVGIGLAGTTDAALELGDVPVPEDTLLLVFAVTPQEELPFTDVEGSIHLEGILALSEAGIVSGFEDDTFRPNASIRRDQMATFLANALELVPTPTDPTFTDIENNVHEANIRAIAAAEVTLGVGDGLYAPAADVPRGQMATFLANGFGYDATDDAPTFLDIAGNVHEDNIRAIAEARITGGLGDGAFGPGQPVTRGQMSTFVARALGLIELAPES